MVQGSTRGSHILVHSTGPRRYNAPKFALNKTREIHMKFRLPVTAACAIMLLVLQGCAIGIRDEPLPEVNRLDLRVSSTPTIKMQVKIKGATPAASRGEMVERARRNIETLLSDANLAVPISTSADADVVMDANLFYDPAGFGPLVTVLSLGIIPASGTNDLKIEASVWRGSKRNDYVLHESYTNVVWWPLIFAAPFKPYIQNDVVLDNMYRTLVQRMKNDGIFGPTP